MAWHGWRARAWPGSLDRDPDPAPRNASVWAGSVRDRDPAAECLAVLQLVGERDRESGDADPALADAISQQLVPADPELPGPLPRADHLGRADIGPVQIRDAAVHLVQCPGVGQGRRPRHRREVGSVHQALAWRDLKAAGPADHDEAAHPGPAQPLDQT